MGRERIVNNRRFASQVSYLKNRKHKLSRAVAGIAAGLLAMSSGAKAANLYWDADGVGAQNGGAGGAWNYTLPHWATAAGGSTYQNFTDSDIAFFTTSGTVDLDTITVK